MPKFPGIPEPTSDPSGLLTTLSACKQALEVILGQRRGSRRDSAVTWGDLVELGLIEENQVPRD